jgi:hypothetical protein
MAWHGKKRHIWERRAVSQSVYKAFFFFLAAEVFIGLKARWRGVNPQGME